MQAALAQHDGLLRDIIENHTGRVIKSTDDTLLTGPVVDQAALHGLPKKRDLGVSLHSFNSIEPDQGVTSNVE